MRIPRTAQDLDDLVADQVRESSQLEYKASNALDFSGSTKHANEFAKDVSALANSDGGVIVYGIAEKDHIPSAVDGGINNAVVTRERIEQRILGNIRPRPKFEVVQISVTPERSAFVVAVERSDRPHQNTIDHKYYKRFNFSAHPMEDYEIEDVRSRRLVSEPEIYIAMEAGGHVVYFTVENASRFPAFDVQFGFPAELKPWLEKNKAPALNRGLRVLSAGRRLRFFYGSYISLIAESSPLPKQFDVSVSYRLTPEGPAKTETLHVDLMDYFGSNVDKTEIEELGAEMKKGFEALTKQVEKIARLVDQHVGPMSTGTGVNISATAIRNLRHVLAGTDLIEKVHATDINVVQEVLQVDRPLALRIWEFLRWPPAEGTLEGIEGMTPSLADDVRKKLVIPVED